MFDKFVLGLALSCASAGVLAQATTAVQAPPNSSAYAENGNGAVMRSSDGLCWRTGYWTPDDSVTGCDGQLTPPIVKPTAPAIVAAPPTAVPAPAVSATAASARCDFTVTLAGDPIFGFDKAALSTTAKKRIDHEFLAKLDACATIEKILVSGHTDHLGAAGYNKKLSERRAEAVSSYLKSKDISTLIETRGFGSSEPLAICDAKLPHKKLRDCLAPNRRVELEIRGIAK